MSRLRNVIARLFPRFWYLRISCQPHTTGTFAPHA